MEYKIEKKKLIIPEGVTEIEKKAFNYNNDFVKVEFPKSLRKIEESAFEGCRELKEITLPEGLTTIEEEAFRDCSNLKTVILPNSLEEIPSKCFDGCSKLTNVTLGNQLKKIQDRAFQGCKALPSITLPISLITIGDSAFEECSSLKSFFMTNIVEYIGERSFADCTSLERVEIDELTYSPLYEDALENTALVNKDRKEHRLTIIGDCVVDGRGCSGELVIPQGIREIGPGAFKNCTRLTKIVFPDTIESISYRAFYGCISLDHVELPNSLDSVLGDYMFEDCTSLKSVVFPKNKTLPIGKEIFKNTPWLREQQEKGLVVINDFLQDGKACKGTVHVNGVKEISGYAFHGNIDITEVIIEEGVETIGYGAFSYCSFLKRVILPKSLKNIYAHAFEYCASLEEIVIPEGVDALYFATFRGCCSLCHVELPSSLEHIYASVFDDCGNLTDVQIPEGTEVYDNALPGEDAAKEKPIILQVPQSYSIGYGAYQDREDIIVAIIPEGVKKIGQRAFSSCRFLRKVVLPDSVEEIEDGAFFPCRNLHEINIPKNLKSIGREAFYDVKVRKMDLPEGLIDIGEEAFSTSYLEEVVIPSTVKWIGRNCFASCEKLEKVTFLANPQEMPEELFSRCGRLTYFSGQGALFQKSMFEGTPLIREIKEANKDSMFEIFAGTLLRAKRKYDESVVIPEGIYSIGEDAFKGHKEIKSVHLPSTLTRIGDRAFMGCTNLSEIHMPDTLQYIGSEAFSDCAFQTFKWPAFVSCIESGTFAGCTALSHIDLPDNLKYIGESAFSGCDIHNWVIPANVHHLSGSTIITDSCWKEDCRDRSGETLTLLGEYLIYEMNDNLYRSIWNEWDDCQQTVLWNGDLSQIKRPAMFHKMVNDFCKGMEMGYAYREETVDRNRKLLRRLMRRTPFFVTFFYYLYILLLRIVNGFLYVVCFPWVFLKSLAHMWSTSGSKQHLFLDRYLEDMSREHKKYNDYENNASKSAVRYMMREGLLKRRHVSRYKKMYSDDEALCKEMDQYLKSR